MESEIIDCVWDDSDDEELEVNDIVDPVGVDGGEDCNFDNSNLEHIQ